MNRRQLIHILRNPSTAVSAIVLFFAVIATATITCYTARIGAQEVLLSAARDMRNEIDDCVGDLLAYQGNTICRHFKTPDAVTEMAVQEVMSRYNLDELNVVDEKGIVIMGALAQRGYDMSTNPNTAKFNCLLKGEKVYGQPFRHAVEDASICRKYVGVAFPPPAKGYIQMGFDESRVRSDIDYWFSTVAYGWHVGDSGFFIVAKSDTGVIDSCGLTIESADGTRRNAFERGQSLASIGLDVDKVPKESNKFFHCRLYGVECLCLTEVCRYHRIVSAMPFAEVYGGVVWTVGLVSLLLFLIFVVAVFFMSRLSDLVKSLRREKAENATRVAREFAAARTIQMSSLPVWIPGRGDFEIQSVMHTAKEVGGDFYDFYPLPSGREFFLIADVSGKGISAAMFMMKARTTIKASMSSQDDLAAAVEMANNRLCEHNDAEMFVTAWLAAIDSKTGEVEFVNAGHNPPLLRRADGTVEWVRSRPSLALAAMPGMKYRSVKLHLNRGDSLILYTDGVTEAQNVGGELYGEARLESTIVAAQPPDYITDCLDSVKDFVGAAEQSDDITILTLTLK